MIVYLVMHNLTHITERVFLSKELAREYVKNHRHQYFIESRETYDEAEATTPIYNQFKFTINKDSLEIVEFVRSTTTTKPFYPVTYVNALEESIVLVQGSISYTQAEQMALNRVKYENFVWKGK